MSAALVERPVGPFLGRSRATALAAGVIFSMISGWTSAPIVFFLMRKIILIAA